MFAHEAGSNHMSQTLLSYEQLKEKGITLSKMQLWRNERDGKFPRRVTVSAQRIAWVESEIDEFIEARIAARKVRP